MGRIYYTSIIMPPGAWDNGPVTSYTTSLEPSIFNDFQIVFDLGGGFSGPHQYKFVVRASGPGGTFRDFSERRHFFGPSPWPLGPGPWPLRPGPGPLGWAQGPIGPGTTGPSLRIPPSLRPSIFNDFQIIFEMGAQRNPPTPPGLRCPCLLLR